MILNALNRLSSALLSILNKELPPFGAESGIRVIIEVQDPYSKELLTSSLIEELKPYMPAEPMPDNFKAIRDSFICMGVEIIFREPGVPTQIEEIKNAIGSRLPPRDPPR